MIPPLVTSAGTAPTQNSMQQTRPTSANTPQPPASLIQRLAQTFAQFGKLNGLLYLLDRAFSLLSHGKLRLIRYVLVAQPVPAAPASPVASSGRSLVRQATAGDPVETAFPRPAQVIAHRWKGGSICFVAEVSERFAGYLWLARGQYHEDEVRCTYVLAQQAISAWDYDVYVEPEFRLGRTLSRLWQAANRHMHQQGVQWTFSRISTFNLNSLAAHARLGIREVGSATFVKAGGAQIMFSSLRPFLHLSFSAQSAPVLQLDPPEHTD